MLTFESDYTEGAHPKVFQRLMEVNMEQVPGYGHDKFSEGAREKIRKAIGVDDAQIYFLTGGTQTNQIVIDSTLKQFEGVVAAQTGHVNCHEAGAIEYTGHKVLPLPQYNGKMKACDLKQFIEDFYNDGSHEHMIFPGMVYVSHPTEYGTLYTKDELKEISQVCHENNLPLFLDGARLGYGLMSRQTDVTLEDIAQLTDVFYIGGTKVGALCGEAVVFTKNNAPAHFENLMKKHGGLLAKGRLNALQFDALFTDGLYFEIARNAIDQAEYLKEQLTALGMKFFIESPTNQQFVILENSLMKKLEEKVGFSFWEKYDERHTVVRFATSWATTREQVDQLVSCLKQLM